MTRTVKVLAFCVDNEIGRIENAQFIPVEFDKFRFLRILGNLMASGKYKVPDLLLKDAIASFVGAEKVAKLYRSSGITNSVFYMKWRNRLISHKRLAKVSEEYQKSRRQKAELVRIEKAKLAIKDSAHELAVEKALRKKKMAKGQC